MTRPGRIPGGPARKAGVNAPRKKTPTAVAAIPPDAGEYLAQSALLFRKGRVGDALDIVIQGLAIDPDNADLLNHRGVFAARLGDVEAAEAAYRRAIDTRPDGAEIHYNLGNLLKALDRSQEAAAAYQRAVALKPDYAEAWANLGNLLQALGRPQEAEAAYRRGIESKPDYADTYSNLGNLLQAQQRPDEAEAAYRRAVALRPEYPEALSNLGVLLKAQRRPLEAEAAYRRAIGLKLDYAEAWSNLGVLLLEQKRMEEAETACRRATEAKPDYADAWSNLGNLLQEQKRLQEAELAYRRALVLHPRNPDARWNLSLLLLRQGRFKEGWREHEARYDPGRKNRKMSPPPTSRDGPPPPPRWQGESLTDRALLIWPEQGLGDEIQFVRYLPLLKARGLKHLTLACKPPLKSLFAAQSMADSVISIDDWRPEMIAGHDFWCYPLSLPLHFGTTPETIPATIPYLAADPDRRARWAPRLPQARFRVGLVWKGNPTHRNDANRSLPSLACLAPLWSLPGIVFVSLQKGAGEDEAGAPPITQSLFHPGSEMADFADSAAILGQLDLLICVDTAIAHLAGALGVPCWVLLPACGTDWRWLEDRRDSPWYPEVMRLFRQTADGDWGGVVARVVDALRAWMAKAGSADPSLAAGGGPANSAQADAAAFVVRSAALYRKGQAREALAVVAQGLAIDPDNADLLNNQGVFAARIGDTATAESAYRHAIAAMPDFALAYSNLGNLLRAQARPQEAEAAYRQAIVVKPDAAEAYCNLGNLLKEQTRPLEAEAAYRKAIAVKPDCVEAWSNLGVLLRAQERPEEAEAAYRHAIAVLPGYAEAHSNLGNLLKAQERSEEAEAEYRHAIAANRDYVDVHYNLGLLLKGQKRVKEAEAALRRVLELKPTHADARFDLGLLLLRMGRFKEGWKEYEARYAPGKTDCKAAAPPVSAQGPSLPPQWQGESLTGRSMLVWTEQGFGDEIQFARYLPLLKARGLKHLTLACKRPLKAIFSAQSVADRVIGADEWQPAMAAEFDFWCYPLSLPLQFGTTLANIPATIPYLRAEPDRMARWAARLPQTAFRVGLVWKGRATHGNDANRSLPSPATLAPLWSVPGIAFVSLQKDAGADEAGVAPADQPLTHLGGEIADFADSAAILSQLDLLICVDTAIAHLAGALGVPCWVLLPDCGTDWRWLEDRVDSPWYPKVMRLFRQPVAGGWASVVPRLVDALGEWTKSAERGEPSLPRVEMPSLASRAAPGWQHFGRNTDLQTPFDVAVIMPTVGRDCILDAVRSVYAQQGVGRIQLLIGVDVPRGDFARLHELLESTPDHVTPCLFHPGYSTSRRHGGLHPAFDGGVLRTVLSYLANARYLAYLDDDNWWAPTHLSSLLSEVQGRNWAFALRWFVHPESRRPVCVDEWESVGPGRGDFLKKFGGWVDPNCLLIDKLACEPALRWWSIPLPGGSGSMAADRHVYHWLQKHGTPGETGSASVYYLMQPDDVLHRRRLDCMGPRYAAAGCVSEGSLPELCPPGPPD